MDFFMPKPVKVLGALLIAFCLVTTVIAQPDSQEDEKIKKWTQKAILQTLAISYDDNPEVYKKVHGYYMYNAWKGLDIFLGRFVGEIDSKKLTIHPRLIGPATISDKGVIKESNFFKGVHYWVVQQLADIPELGFQINFTFIVLQKADMGYIIHNLDMSLIYPK